MPCSVVTKPPGAAAQGSHSRGRRADGGRRCRRAAARPDQSTLDSVMPVAAAKAACNSLARISLAPGATLLPPPPHRPEQDVIDRLAIGDGAVPGMVQGSSSRSPPTERRRRRIGRCPHGEGDIDRVRDMIVILDLRLGQRRSSTTDQSTGLEPRKKPAVHQNLPISRRICAPAPKVMVVWGWAHRPDARAPELRSGCRPNGRRSRGIPCGTR